MPPPFQRVYDYFLSDTKIYVRNNNIPWSNANITNTVSAIWAADQAVRAHYAGSEGSNPGPGLPLPNPIPAAPYTKTDVKRAKARGVLPARAAGPVQPPPPAAGPPAAGQHVPGQPPAAPLQSATSPRGAGPSQVAGPSQGAGPSRTAEAQGASGAASGVNVRREQDKNPDRRPYDFWPELPWPDTTHTWPPIGRTVKNDDPETQEWLDGELLKPDEDEGEWIGAKLLGYGSYGVAGLWVKRDKHNNIVQRMVVKDTKPDITGWKDPKNWRGRLPQEIKIHELVEECRKDDPYRCRNLIKYYGHSLSMTQRTYRIYLEYCGGGNFFSALDQRRETTGLVPEAYVWYVIQALARSLTVLKDGTTEQQGWRPITHLDVQMQNVLLDVRPKHEDERREQPDDEPGPSRRHHPGDDLDDDRLHEPRDTPKNGSEKTSGDNRHESDQPQDNYDLYADPDETVTAASQTSAENPPPRRLKGKGAAKTTEESTGEGPEGDREPTIRKSKRKAESPEEPAVKKARTNETPMRLEPILADFGLAFYDVEDDCPLKANPVEYMCWENNTRYAPEFQCQYEKPFKPLDEKADVWGIGQIAWELIVNQSVDGGAGREDKVDPDRGYIPLGYVEETSAIDGLTENMTLTGAMFPKSRGYSKELKALVRKCLEYRAANRPALIDLLIQSTDWLAAHPGQATRLDDVNALGLRIPNQSTFAIGNRFNKKRTSKRDT